MSLVALEDRREYSQKRLRPPLVVEGTGPLGDLLQGKPAALEVLQESRQDADERVNSSPVFEDRKYPLPWQRHQLHAVRRQLLLKVPDQPALGAFAREGFDQDGVPFGVDLPFPLHPLEIFLPVDERRRVSRGVEPEMLDVDAVVGKMEVGLVLALLDRRRLMLVGRFVVVGNAVEIEEVRDLALLVAFDLVTLQRPDVIPADVVSNTRPSLETRARSCKAQTGPGTIPAPFPIAPRRPADRRRCP